jgi:hypothetical protein
MNIDQDAVVDYALNYGIKKAGKKYHLRELDVHGFITEFVKSVSVINGCSCENGTASFCWMCNGREVIFISASLIERLRKINFQLNTVI